MVLLKNENDILPLQRDVVKSIAVLGPYAIRAMTGGGGSSHIKPLYTVSPVQGLFDLGDGLNYIVQDGADISAAVDAAKKVDVAIVMVGQETTEGRDQQIELDDAQNKLIAAVAKQNSRTIVVLKTGSAVLMPWLSDVPAVLEAWYPGEEDGHAVADILFGFVNPSGKLPITFPRKVEDTPACDVSSYPGDGTTVHYKESLAVGYRRYGVRGISPLFPFGFGLSYTRFRFDRLKIARTSLGVSVSFELTNIGRRAGSEVAQVYLSYPPISEGKEPPRQLRAFKKVMLQPGESAMVTFQLGARAFSYWSEREIKWKVAPGIFGVIVGDSSIAARLQGTVEINELPDIQQNRQR